MQLAALLMEDGKNWHVFSGCSLCWYLSWEKESTFKVVRRRKAQISFNSWALIASSLVILISLRLHHNIVCIHTLYFISCQPKLIVFIQLSFQLHLLVSSATVVKKVRKGGVFSFSHKFLLAKFLSRILLPVYHSDNFAL